MHESPTGPDSESDQSLERHLPPRVTGHSGDLEKAAGLSVETQKDRVATVRALLEKPPWMSQYLKNPHVATVASKTEPTASQPRSWERPKRQRGNDSTDDTKADDTDPSAECDIPIHRVTSPEAP